MNIEFKLNKSNKESKKGYALVIYTYIDKIKNIPTPYHSRLEDWDNIKKEPKRTHPSYSAVLEYVLTKKLQINAILDKPQNFSSFTQVKNFLANEKPDSYLNFLKNYTEELNQNKVKTWTAYNDAYVVLEKYQNEISFSDLDYAFLKKFRDYKLNNGCNSGGIHTYLRTLRAAYNEAVKRKIYKPDDVISPFKGVMPKLSKTKDKHFFLPEVRSLYAKISEKKVYHDFDNYFLLCFYLGGLDFIDLANLRYDLHVKGDRIQFTRFKGGTQEYIDNAIVPEAKEILKKYLDHAPFLVNIHKFQYKSLRDNFSARYRKFTSTIVDENSKRLIESYFTSKTARYTFIDLGKQLELNREIVMEITGHSNNDTHSIYEGRFSYEAKDKVHRKIIDAVTC